LIAKVRSPGSFDSNASQTERAFGST
jgi:hypothetical protein